MVFRVLSCQWNGAASAIPDLLRKLNAFPSQRLEGIAALTDMSVQTALVVTPTRSFMPSLIAMPRTWVRAARLTMRQQRMKPSNLAERVAVFKQKLRASRTAACARARTGRGRELGRAGATARCAISLKLTYRAISSSAAYRRAASIVCIIRTLQALGVTDRRIWLYDTFEGMPKPEAVDIHYAQTPEEDGGLKSWKRHKFADERGSDCRYCPIDEVRRTVVRTGYPEHNLLFVKGLVETQIRARCRNALPCSVSIPISTARPNTS
jgi:hypothetical protein